MISFNQCVLRQIGHGVEDKRHSVVFDFLSLVASATRCPLLCMSTKWINKAALSNLIDDLNHSASEPRRTALLICGSHLEDQITVFSLEALLEGFDVHLLCDLILPRDLKLKPVLLLRLFQAGAVPSSLRQFLYSWLASEIDQNMTAELQRLLDEYDTRFASRVQLSM
jgi:hypothetical protein